MAPSCVSTEAQRERQERKLCMEGKFNRAYDER